MNLDLKSRDEIPLLLNELGLTGDGVEIGVHAGGFTDVLLKASHLARIYAIDAWHDDYPGGVWPDADHGFKRAADYLWHHGHRAVMIRLPSVEAAPLFRDESLDFVYIDANHTLEAVTSDLAAWWPKVRPGGLFAGHDYNDTAPQVCQAVDAFIAEWGLALHLTDLDFWHEFPAGHALAGTRDRIRSWLTVKP